MTLSPNPEVVRLGIPKGRMFDGVSQLLAGAGIRLQLAAREYRPEISLPGFETKLLKPQAIVRMLQHGSRDIGFAGADWVSEYGADLVELLDTGLDAVRIVVAAPKGRDRDWLQRPFVVATELGQITQNWLAANNYPGEVVMSFGSTEVYPPEDADCIVDVVASGATLQANGLEVIDELMTSTTRLYATPAAMELKQSRESTEQLVILLQSVLDARMRVMVEVNVSPESLQSIVENLPCMREPTISRLHGQGGYAVKVAAPRNGLPALIARIKALGGTDIVVSQISQIVS